MQEIIWEGVVFVFLLAVILLKDKFTLQQLLGGGLVVALVAWKGAKS